MLDDDYPIGSLLQDIIVSEDKDFAGDELCLDAVKFVFQDSIITLIPLPDSDEIAIECQASHGQRSSNSAPI